MSESTALGEMHAALRDAERYRWLRKRKPATILYECFAIETGRDFGELLDKAIDEAIDQAIAADRSKKAAARPD